MRISWARSHSSLNGTVQCPLWSVINWRGTIINHDLLADRKSTSGTRLHVEGQSAMAEGPQRRAGGGEY